MTLFLYPPRALPKSRELNLDSRAQWPTSRNMICSQGALAKEWRGQFFLKERERGTREGAGKLKRGKVFFGTKERGTGKKQRKKGAKGPSNAKTIGR